MIHHIENERIIDEVIKSDKLVLIDFFATWCAPCQMMTDVLHDIGKDINRPFRKTERCQGTTKREYKACCCRES